MDTFIALGVAVRDLVLGFASILKAEAAPGIVTLGLGATLIVAVACYSIACFRRLQAIKWLRTRIKSQPDPAAFARSIGTITEAIDQQANSAERKHLRDAFLEFRDTLVSPISNEEPVLHNSIRPNQFLNADDLHFTAGFWRIWPGLFVTIGLFFTFLGLISALSAMDLSAGKVDASLRDLLTIASAKFIMSLTGLFCSIIFTIVLRIGFVSIEKALYDLCHTLERQLSFISLEEIGFKQLRAVSEQREHLQNLAFEMVAELGRPLREELPQAISNSISSAMAPLLNQVGQIGTDGMQSMVQDLSSRFSDDVGNALSEASQRLVQAGERIGTLADRMDQSSGRMGTEMESAVARLAQAVDELRETMGATVDVTSGVINEGAEHLLAVMNQTLEGIRDNTGEGARAMSAASAELRVSAELFRSELEGAAKDSAAAARQRMEETSREASGSIDAAARGVVEAFGRRSQEIAQMSKGVTERATRELLEPLGQVATQLGALAESITESSQGVRRLSDGIRAGADATEQAAVSFRSASGSLVDAAAPVRATSERMEAAARQLAESTSHVATTVSQAAESTARGAADTLAAAREALGGQARAIEASLTAVTAMMEKLKGQAARLDGIDEKLGAAFEAYTGQVETAVNTLQTHVRTMQSDLAPALDTMRAIVDQAEKFAPESRRL